MILNHGAKCQSNEEYIVVGCDDSVGVVVDVVVVCGSSSNGSGGSNCVGGRGNDNTGCSDIVVITF